MSPTSDDPRPSAAAAGKPTLDQLLRVKRAERPDEAFWREFDRGFRQKQLAASIEPRPWWLGLSLLGRRLAPLGLPISAGAAALLALMVFRTQTPDSLTAPRPANSDSVALAALAKHSSPAFHATTVAVSTAEKSVSAEGPSLAEAAPIAPDNEPPSSSYAATMPGDAPRQTTSETRTAAAPAEEAPVMAALLALPAPAPTPSELTIAENLETVRAEEPELIAASAPGFANLGESRADEMEEETASDVSRLINPRHARLLAMADDSSSHGTDLATVRERMVHRLVNDDTNYGSSSRLAAAGDRFSLSF